MTFQGGEAHRLVNGVESGPHPFIFCEEQRRVRVLVDDETALPFRCALSLLGLAFGAVTDGDMEFAGRAFRLMEADPAPEEVNCGR